MCEQFKAGRLPHLRELAIYSSEGDSAFADALEARRELGLPPITRLRGFDWLSAAFFRRIWPCCPPEKVERLVALDESLAALGELAYSRFPALRSLLVDTSYRHERNDGRHLGGILWALRGGRASAVEVWRLRQTMAQMSWPPLCGSWQRGSCRRCRR